MLDRMATSIFSPGILFYLQVSTIAEASISVQQAEHTILKCKAAVAAQRTSPSADSSKTPVAGTTVRSNSLLFELAGVHACSDDTYAQSAVRRVRVPMSVKLICHVEVHNP